MNTPKTSLITDEAVGWFVSLRAEDATEEQFLAFRDWLEASEDHRAAYDQVETLWVELDQAATRQPATTPMFQPRRAVRRAPASMSRRLWAGAGLAIAAGLAAVIVLPQMAAPHIDIYRTAKGETRVVALADGSTLTLNSATEARVQMSRKTRQVTLASGEALFDVAHDAARPFQVSVGDEQVRDIGTAFDILRRDDEVTVSVLRGLVDVTPAAGAETRLGQGDTLNRRIGAAEARQGKIDPQEVASWRTGRLIYRDQPLSAVAADLNRYLPIPIAVDAKAADLRFSGVLQLDREDLMVDRLQRLMPISARSTTQTVRLSPRG